MFQEDLLCLLKVDIAAYRNLLTSKVNKTRIRGTDAAPSTSAIRIVRYRGVVGKAPKAKNALCLGE
jgi:hypothetical protein